MSVFARTLALPATTAVLLAITSGCATPSGGTPPPSAPALVVGTGTVIEAAGRAKLCSVVAESYPPQCGAGIELRGWTWEGVEGSDTASDVTWGSYAVQGNVDGDVLNVTEPPILLALYDVAPRVATDDPAQKSLDERFGEGFLWIVEPGSN
ncbi:hypothetical protein ACFXP7_09515 [Microbacterium sp. P06]|uniref:hypothetical protein n=1 Tax=Microbacterium sp. P06 TaxID=3366949 RepID=UPI0037476B46